VAIAVGTTTVYSGHMTTETETALADQTYAELAGIAELADMLNARRTTVSQWHSRQATNGFPEPVAVLAMGPVWLRSEVLNWWRAYKPMRSTTKAGTDPDVAALEQSSVGEPVGYRV
jgi:hypothetical protein